MHVFLQDGPKTTLFLKL